MGFVVCKGWRAGVGGGRTVAPHARDGPVRSLALT